MKRIAQTLFALLFLIFPACGTLEISVEGTPTANLAATGTLGALQTQNAELATKIAMVTPSTDAASPIPTLLSGSPAAPTAPPATRITFLKGASVGVVSSPIAPGQTQTYVVDVFQAQPMFVYVASANNDVTVSIEAETGTSILSVGAHQNSWQGSLSQAGDYYLTIHGGASTENFSLTVTVPWRLQFATGADSATVSGDTVAGYNVSYTVYALKGQKMRVDLENLSSKASLSILGFTDGKHYVRPDEGQKSFQFTLPTTQDYVISVVPMDGLVLSYVMTIKIQ